jgi:iron complex transport system permease protein
MTEVRAPDARPRSLRRARTVLGLLAALALLSATASLGIGAVPVPPAEILSVLRDRVLGTPPDDAATDAIIWSTRAPRVAAAAGAGAALAVVGAALQAMVRNGLADPYVLGISAGASAGAGAALVLGAGASLAVGILPLAAFAGAAASAAAVLLLVGRRQSSPARLVLTGVAVGYVGTALTNLAVFLADSPEVSRSIVFWTLGSFSGISWPEALVTLVAALLAVAVLLLAARHLDALAAGDLTATAVGIDPRAVRIVLFLLTSLAVGLVVSVAGGIGFVGLVVPHLARRLVGARHGALLPAAALLGAILLLWGDIVARTAFSPQELPVGVVTGLVGAPFLLHLLRRSS